MEGLTGFATKNSITLPSLANKYFNGLRNENNETICTYNDEYMRYFLTKGIKGDRCGALKQFYKSVFSDELFSIISTELNIDGNVFEILYN